MGFSFKIESKAATDLIKRAVSNMENASTVMNVIASVAYKDVIDHFSTESGPKSKWKPWKDPNYRGGSGKKLQDKGLLRGSIDMRSSDDSAEVFTNLSYASVNNDKRKFLWMSKTARELVSKIFGDSIIKG